MFFSLLSFKVKNGPTYNCTECSCVFKSLGSLNTHISKMHVGGTQNPAGPAETAHVLTVRLASAARGPCRRVGHLGRDLSGGLFLRLCSSTEVL